MKKSKAAPTEEQIQDSIRLRKLFAERAGMSQLEFGQIYEIGNQGMVWQYLNADKPNGSALNVSSAIKFADGLRCRVADFSPSIQKEIDRIATFASTAKGDTATHEEDKSGSKPKVEQEASVCNAYKLANYETKEVIDLVLLGSNDPLPKWANEEMRRSINSIKYSVIEWSRMKKKSN